MITELSFLIDLLLTKRSPKEKIVLITERIKEIENQKTQPQVFVHPGPNAQAQSTIANLMKDQVTAPVAQALANRQSLIQSAHSDKPEPGRTSPRKF